MDSADRPGEREAVEAAFAAAVMYYKEGSSLGHPDQPESIRVAVAAAYPHIEKAVREDYERTATSVPAIRAYERRRIVEALREFHDPEARHNCMDNAIEVIRSLDVS